MEVSPSISHMRRKSCLEQCLFSCRGPVLNGYCQRHRDMNLTPSASFSLRKHWTPSSPQTSFTKKKHWIPSDSKSSSPISKTTIQMTPETPETPGTPIIQRKLRSLAQANKNTLNNMINATRRLAAQTDPVHIATLLIKETIDLLNCDRCTFYFVDEGELLLLVSKGMKEIRLKIGQGIAGTVAATGEILNITEPYKDNRFNQSFDKQTGYKTCSLLAVPVIDDEGEIVAVLQAINKLPSDSAKFSDEDILTLEHLAHHTGVLLKNAQLFESGQRAHKKMSAMLDLIRLLHTGSSSASTAFTLSQHAHELVDGENCTLYMIDRSRNILVSLSDESTIGFPSKGIISTVIKTGQNIVLQSITDDCLFINDIDGKKGIKINNLMCLPIMNKPKEIIGVLTIYNKYGEFDKEDEELLFVLLEVAGSIFDRSPLFQSVRESKPSEAQSAFNSIPFQSTELNHVRRVSMIEEQDEDD